MDFPSPVFLNNGEGNGTPLQYSCLENPVDGGAWWAAVHGVPKSWTWPSDFTLTFHFHALEKEMATHSSVRAWRIPGTVEPGGLLSMGSHRVGDDWSDLAAAAAVSWYPPPTPSKESDADRSHSLRFPWKMEKSHRTYWYRKPTWLFPQRGQLSPLPDSLLLPEGLMGWTTIFCKDGYLLSQSSRPLSQVCIGGVLRLPKTWYYFSLVSPWGSFKIKPFHKFSCVTE